MSDDLKPCPFCGGEAAMESGRYELDDGMYAFAHVECLSCGACGSGFTEADSPVEMVGHLASEAWNRRAERTCLAKPYEVDGETGFYDCIECECGEVNDVSARYCNRCGGLIEVVYE